MVDHEIHDQQQQQRAREVATLPLAAALRAAGAGEPIVRDILMTCPERTPAELHRALDLAALRQAQGRVDSAEGLVFGVWRQG